MQSTQMLGTKLVGRYQIIRNLGGGGFGETYVACDTQLPGSPQCVVKKLKPLATDVETLQTARRLFDTEAQVLFQLGSYDHIPQLLAYFEDNQEFYLVQELIAGHDLSQELGTDKAWNQTEVIDLLREILTILDFVHQQNVIHRDINPHNIIRRDRDGKLFLIDFGAVKQITTHVVNSQVIPNRTVAIGTPGYMAAEQAQGNPRLSSDIYSVGSLAIQALTGLSPGDLDRDENYEIAWKDIAKVEIDAQFAEIIDKMVCHDFRMRYPSAGSVLEDIDRFSSKGKVTATLALAPAGGIQSAPSRKPIRKKPIIIAMVSALGLTMAGVAAAAFITQGINQVNSRQSYQQANTLYELNRYEDALTAYNKALEIRDNYPQAWNGKGKVLFALKRDREALGAYERAIQIEPDLIEAWRGRGLVLARLKKYNEAIAAFDKVLEVDEQQGEIWYEKGKALAQLDRYEQAIKAYEEAIAIDKEKPEYFYNRAISLQKLNRFDDAVKSYDRAIKLKANYTNAWYQRGNALFNLKRYQDALASYDQAVQQQPNLISAWLARGNIFMNQQKYNDAIASFDRVNKLNRNYYAAWYGKGWSLHQLQRYDEAIKAYNRAIALRPSYHQPRYNLGNVFYQQEKYQAALNAYNQAIRVDGNQPESWYSRGNAYMNLQQYEKAKSDYERAIALKSDYKAAIKARKKVEDLLEEINKQEEQKREETTQGSRDRRKSWSWRWF